MEIKRHLNQNSRVIRHAKEERNEILFTLLCGVMLLFANDINHVNVKTVEAGSLHEIKLTAEGASAVYLHYRTNIADRYQIVEMIENGYEIIKDIRIPKENASELEYYFSIVKLNGTMETYPNVSQR